MRWEGGNVSVSHSRAPWGPSGDEWTFVNGRIDQVNGDNRDYGDLKRDYYRTYLAAKHEFGMKSAYEIIDRCVKPEVVTSLAQVVSKLDPRPMLIFPHPAFDDEEGVDGKKPLGAFPNNALPRKQPSRRSTKSFHPPPQTRRHGERRPCGKAGNCGISGDSGHGLWACQRVTATTMATGVTEKHIGRSWKLPPT
jgi:hypothetical protein